MKLCHYFSDPFAALRQFSIWVLGVMIGSSPVSALEVFVSPGGSDQNPGTLALPFQTIEKARDAVRSLRGSSSADYLVNLRGGVYQLASPVQFTEPDSGSPGHPVIYQAYPSETPVLSGGHAITGWTPADGGKNLWVAACPGLNTRQLYVNGVRATRAHSGGAPKGWTKTVYGYTTPDDTLASWRNPSALEFVYNAMQGGTGGGKWTERRCGVERIAGHEIRMKQPGWASISKLDDKGQPTSLTAMFPTDIENASELLTQPGEWYLDRPAGKVYYLPLPNQDLKTATVIAPELESLVALSGASGSPVHEIEFKGLAFVYATWLVPSTGTGFPETQANCCSISDDPTKPGNSPTNPPADFFPAAAVTVHHGRNIRLDPPHSAPR